MKRALFLDICGDTGAKKRGLELAAYCPKISKDLAFAWIYNLGDVQLPRDRENAPVDREHVEQPPALTI